jgi:hypothetical protein
MPLQRVSAECPRNTFGRRSRDRDQYSGGAATCALSSYYLTFFVVMTCRLFIDEVGNDDTRSASERYLSLTGIITKTHGHDHRITPAIEALKAKFFGHDPPRKVVVLHRREIVRREPPFDCLWDDDTNAKWEDALIGLIEYLYAPSS